MTTPIAVTVTALPQTLAFADREAFAVGLDVKNLGPDTLDPQLGQSVLSVNGAASADWKLALNNSGHPKTWRALPAGQHVTGHWKLGTSLFPKPGDYQLVLVVSGVTSQPVTVRVTP